MRREGAGEHGRDREALAAVYALGALDGGDRARFEALLDSADRGATSALAEFEATLVELAAESVAVPPAAAKAAVMMHAGKS